MPTALLLRVSGVDGPGPSGLRLIALRAGSINPSGPTEQTVPHYFDHENLDCYRLAVESARWVCKSSWPKGMSELKSQAVRASASVCLNIAEGCARKGRAGINHLRIANGSAAETAAAIDIAFGDRAAGQKEQLRRVSAMLAGLIKRLE